MSKHPFLLFIIPALIIGMASQALGEVKSFYTAQGNNVGAIIGTGYGGPIWGQTQFPKGSGNFYGTHNDSKWDIDSDDTRINWGVSVARDVDGDGAPEDTVYNQHRGAHIYGCNSSLESYSLLEELYNAGNNMFEAASRPEVNRVYSSLDPEDLAAWPPEFREGRSATGAPIIKGVETVCVRFGDAFHERGAASGVSMEYQFYFLNYAESNNMVYQHVLIRNMSEYNKWNPVKSFAQRMAATPNGQMWHGWHMHFALTRMRIGGSDEGWMLYSPKSINGIVDKDNFESSFAGNVPAMVAHMPLRLPSFGGETLKLANFCAHGWTCEYGFCGAEDALEGGYNPGRSYQYGLGENSSVLFYPGFMSPWTGEQAFGYPGVLKPGDARYEQWMWGDRAKENDYIFWSELHNFAPRDTTSGDFVLMWVMPPEVDWVIPKSTLDVVDDPNVQAHFAPILEYANVAELVYEGGHILPETPKPPAMTIIPGDRQVTITWSDVNFQTPDAYYSFLQKHPELDPESRYVQYDMEGYRLYRSFVGPSDSHSVLIFECSKGDNNVTFFYVDSYDKDQPLYRMWNGKKVWYALVPFDKNYDTETGAVYSLPDPASGKVWNRPGQNLYTVIPRSEASNYRAASQIGSTAYVGPATQPEAYVELSGDGTGKLTEAPKFLQPQLDIAFEPVINERINQDFTVYVACTAIEVNFGCSYWAYPQRVISLLDANGNVISTASPFLTRDAAVEQVLTDTPDADGVNYAVHVLYDRSDIPVGNRDYAPVYIDFNTGGYAGAEIANQFGSCVDTRIGTGPSIGSYIKTGVFEVTWKAAGGDLTVEVTDKLRGGTVPFSPYREDEAWGFMPGGTYMDFYDEIKNGVSKSERANLMLEKIPADNTDEFALALNGIVWAFTDLSAMPASRTVMTVTNCFGTWNDDQTVFTQYCDAPYLGDKWQIDVKAMSKAPDDADFSMISVVPNPYIASSILDLSTDSRRIEFVNLPDKCTIRIYSMGGNLVNVLNHIGINRHGWGDYKDWDRLDINSQPRDLQGYDNHGGTEPWNLRNRFGQTVASGLYFYVVTDSRGKKHTDKFYIIN